MATIQVALASQQAFTQMLWDVFVDGLKCETVRQLSLDVSARFAIGKPPSSVSKTGDTKSTMSRMADGTTSLLT